MSTTTTQPVRNQKDISSRSFNFRPITHWRDNIHDQIDMTVLIQRQVAQ